MLDFEVLKRYKLYINTLQKMLDSYFEDQKEFIFCKKGCAHCCERGQYPYSRLEFDYLMIGFFKIEMEEQKAVIKRIQELKAEYEKCENKEKFMYRCPFLSEKKECTLYSYRGIICRIFGLLKPTQKEEIIMPFCQSLGLNYSNVYNSAEKIIDDNLVKEKGYKKTPKAYDLSFKTLMSEDFLGENKLDFGEIKSLVEWL